MITNTSCTIYNKLEDGTFKRTYHPAIFWRNVKSEQIKRYGADNASSVSVMVFANQLSDYVKAENFDGNGWTADTNNDTYIVKGECYIDVFDDISELYRNCREAYKVCDVIENLYGSSNLWHIKIEGK